MSDEQVLEAAIAFPPVPVAGPLSDFGKKVVKYNEIVRAVVGELKVRGFSLKEILLVVGMIGAFIAEHGEEISKIVEAIVAWFGK